jgi:predicted lipoprotein with Yx(FWY)xxD motif
MTRLTAALMLPATLALAGLPGGAFAENSAFTTVKTGPVEVLADARGMTLYVFDKDSDGMSACYDKCAANWPPMLAAAGAMADDDFGLIQRKDGSMQWTYYGKPLYLWVKDTKPGDMTGDGMNGVWHVAKPQD